MTPTSRVKPADGVSLEFDFVCESLCSSVFPGILVAKDCSVVDLGVKRRFHFVEGNR